METPRPLILAILLMVLLLASPLFLVAYDDHTTHPALTTEIIKLYNLKFPLLTIAGRLLMYCACLHLEMRNPHRCIKSPVDDQLLTRPSGVVS